MNYPEKIQKEFPLAELTTFKLGGPAEYYFEAKTKEDLRELMDWAKKNDLNYYLMGGGSNLLVNDRGVEGLVVRLMNNGSTVRGERMECGAGLLLANAATAATGKSLSGLEWSVGIPRATLGGAVRGNAGAFGTAICETVETVEAFDIKKGSFKVFSNKDCDFSYRTSIFKKKPGLIIWNVTLKLKKKDIKAIKEKIQYVVDFRNSRYPKLPSAGSVFENLTKETVKMANQALFERAINDKAFRGEKIGAGYIIDQCGLRGKKIGGIKISLEHANHIVNTGSGSAEEVLMLISYIKQQVRDRFGIMLKEELQYLGFED